MRDKAFPYLRHYGLKTGLIAGHTDYGRFIILGRSRVGSNFLRGLLNSHRQIAVFGELFQTQKKIGWALPGFQTARTTRSRFLSDPVRFLEQDVFTGFPLDIAAVGFKIFYYHAQQDEWQPIWPYLKAQKDLKVIHIKRWNILKTHLSRKRASLTDVWVNTTQGQNEDKPITLNYAECIEDFEATREAEVQFDAFFSDHDKIEIVYEQLAENSESVMGQVQDFLGVEKDNLVPETRKQSHQPMSQTVANYSELKTRFMDTPWIEFFDEE